MCTCMCCFYTAFSVFLLLSESLSCIMMCYFAPYGESTLFKQNWHVKYLVSQVLEITTMLRFLGLGLCLFNFSHEKHNANCRRPKPFIFKWSWYAPSRVSAWCKRQQRSTSFEKVYLKFLTVGIKNSGHLENIYILLRFLFYCIKQIK